MTTYHKINSASKDELKQIAIKTAELNQKMYDALELCLKALPIANETELQDNARLAAFDALAEARGNL